MSVNQWQAYKTCMHTNAKLFFYSCLERCTEQNSGLKTLSSKGAWSLLPACLVSSQGLWPLTSDTFSMQDVAINGELLKSGESVLCTSVISVQQERSLLCPLPADCHIVTELLRNLR